jgi:serine/threonine-protein kinase HipA
MSVSAEPMQDGVSISGVQPKLAVGLEGGRYVARTKLGDTHLIAKLPVVGYPRLPELEDLSLRLAAAAGVNTCKTELVPLARLSVEHHYDLGEVDTSTHFLAVHRYDRDQPGRVHCEDFCQALGVWPEDKYTGASYQGVAAVLLTLLGEAGVHELLRRLLVNEMLGNPDMHLKNIGLRYPDGRTAELPPAYDIVGYAAYQQRRGHALYLLEQDRQQIGARPRVTASKEGSAPPSKPGLSPMLLRQFCAGLGLPEKPAAAALKRCAERALQTWPALIEHSGITPQMKARLLTHFHGHVMVVGLVRRQSSRQSEGRT